MEVECALSSDSFLKYKPPLTSLLTYLLTYLMSSYCHIEDSLIRIHLLSIQFHRYHHHHHQSLACRPPGGVIIPSAATSGYHASNTSCRYYRISRREMIHIVCSRIQRSRDGATSALLAILHYTAAM